MRSTERLIALLESVNATAINNDVERGTGVGDHIAGLCREAAQRLRELEFAHQERMEQVGEFLASKGYGNGDVPVADEPDIMDDSFEDGNRGC